MAAMSEPVVAPRGAAGGHRPHRAPQQRPATRAVRRPVRGVPAPPACGCASCAPSVEELAQLSDRVRVTRWAGVLTVVARSRPSRPPRRHRREQAPDETLSTPASGPADWRSARRVPGRRGWTREAETETGQKRHAGAATGRCGAQGRAAEARGRDPQDQRALRGPAVPETRGREVEPTQPRAGRDRGGHRRAPSPQRAESSRSLTTTPGAPPPFESRGSHRHARLCSGDETPAEGEGEHDRPRSPSGRLGPAV
jgi:hypothetical protein